MWLALDGNALSSALSRVPASLAAGVIATNAAEPAGVFAFS
jgi:hypothetical protein